MARTQTITKEVRRALAHRRGVASESMESLHDAGNRWWLALLPDDSQQRFIEQGLSAMARGVDRGDWSSDGRASLSLRSPTQHPVVDSFPTAAERRIPDVARLANVSYLHDEVTYHAWGPAEQRHAEKQMQLAMHYGMGAQQMNVDWKNLLHQHMFYKQQGHPFARDASNGPFSITLYNGKRSKMKGGKRAYKVINNRGVRVHRGSLSSCKHACEQLNLKYAEWLMLQP
jgi:hypothetical protein